MYAYILYDNFIARAHVSFFFYFFFARSCDELDQYALIEFLLAFSKSIGDRSDGQSIEREKCQQIK